MWTVLALSGIDAPEGVAAAREKALKRPSETKPGTTIDARALRLLVEHRFGKPDHAATLLDELLKTQRDDGGWGWQPDDVSEAWPAGIALYALGSLGDKAPVDAINRTCEFLAKTQREDASWFVQGKLTKNDKMASYFGTAWAVIGLSRNRSEPTNTIQRSVP